MTRLAATVVVGEPTTPPTECATCGFDALLTFPLTVITNDGVGSWGTAKRCARCWMEGDL